MHHVGVGAQLRPGEGELRQRPREIQRETHRPVRPGLRQHVGGRPRRNVSRPVKRRLAQDRHGRAGTAVAHGDAKAGEIIGKIRRRRRRVEVQQRRIGSHGNGRLDRRGHFGIAVGIHHLRGEGVGSRQHAGQRRAVRAGRGNADQRRPQIEIDVVNRPKAIGIADRGVQLDGGRRAQGAAGLAKRDREIVGRDVCVQHKIVQQHCAKGRRLLAVRVKPHGGDVGARQLEHPRRDGRRVHRYQRFAHGFQLRPRRVQRVRRPGRMQRQRTSRHQADAGESEGLHLIGQRQCERDRPRLAQPDLREQIRRRRRCRQGAPGEIVALVGFQARAQGGIGDRHTEARQVVGQRRPAHRAGRSVKTIEVDDAHARAGGDGERNWRGTAGGAVVVAGHRGEVVGPGGKVLQRQRGGRAKRAADQGLAFVEINFRGAGGSLRAQRQTAWRGA